MHFLPIRAVIIFYTFLLIASPLFLSAQDAQLIEAEGAIQVGNHSSDQANPGTIRWSGTDLEVFNGSIWKSLTGNSVIGSVNDVDGNIYQTIRIDGCEWMVDNLTVTSFRGGTPIAQLDEDSDWAEADQNQKPGWCWYDLDESYEAPYGKLYNFYAVVGDSICPTGWTIPDMDYYGAASILMSPNSGGRIKDQGLDHWTTPNTDATNETGFTALPGGLRSEDAQFSGLGEEFNLWTSAEPSASEGASIQATYNSGLLTNHSNDKRAGLTVRCVKFCN